MQACTGWLSAPSGMAASRSRHTLLPSSALCFFVRENYSWFSWFNKNKKKSLIKEGS
jgi:hypothetical protein